MKTRSILVLPLLLSIAAAQTAQPPKPMARTDVYHVHFVKAALGQASQLADFLKTQNPKAPMPGHYLVLRHQQGDAWDFVAIEHLGTKSVTIDAAGTPAPPAARDATDWHTDTFVSGPPWADFARAMALEGEAAAKAAGSVYVVSVYRAAPGHREQLEKVLADTRAGGGAAGNVLLQHLEGGPWQYLSVARYNSWGDFATSNAKSTAETQKGAGDWFEIRNHVAFHNDTITDRMTP
ncbi:MAG TPA: hypothetical protein VN428_10910 [Bryobacteraceae bacterium]|nr:hypothetical protein [Bryobacteraceae bacterium]